jgi:hypothetical protein
VIPPISETIQHLSLVPDLGHLIQYPLDSSISFKMTGKN